MAILKDMLVGLSHNAPEFLEAPSTDVLLTLFENYPGYYSSLAKLATEFGLVEATLHARFSSNELKDRYQAEQRRRGNQNRGGSRNFSNHEIVIIRRDDRARDVIAKEWSVSPSVIWKIQTRRTYQYIDDDGTGERPKRRYTNRERQTLPLLMSHSRLTGEEVASIREAVENGVPRKEIARQYSIAQAYISQIVYGNIHRGIPGIKKRPTRAIVTPDGLFRSVASAAKHYGLTYHTAFSRASQRLMGWRFADKETRTITYARAVITPIGRFETIRLAADHHRIKVSTARNRANREIMGWCWEKDGPTKKTYGERFMFQGQSRTLMEIAALVDMSYDALHYRVVEKKMDINDAVVYRMGKSGDHNGRYDPTIRHFIHDDGRKFKGTQMEFRELSGIAPQDCSSLISGRYQTSGGWSLGTQRFSAAARRSAATRKAKETMGPERRSKAVQLGHAKRSARTGIPAGIQKRADGYFAVFALKSDYGKTIYIGYCQTIEDAVATQKQFYLDHPASSAPDDHPKKREFVSYDEACRLVEIAGIRSQKQFYQWKERPSSLPSTPEKTYRGKGWINWGTFTGSGRTRRMTTPGSTRSREHNLT